MYFILLLSVNIGAFGSIFSDFQKIAIFSLPLVFGVLFANQITHKVNATQGQIRQRKQDKRPHFLETKENINK